MNTDIDRRDFSDMQSVLLHARSPVRKCILICRQMKIEMLVANMQGWDYRLQHRTQQVKINKIS